MNSTLFNNSQPLVSIGVPVYNEAKYVQQSLNSLLEQNYANIELIISDNCSTDNTYSICKESLKNCPHATLNRFTSNMGATLNFSFVRKQAKGKYFMWASGHDLWASDYIKKNVDILENIPQSVIASGSSEWIDSSGNLIDRFFGFSDTRGMSSLARFFTVYFGNMHPVLGVIRNSALEQTQPLRPVVGADLILLLELSLLGDFVHANNTEWKRREFRDEFCHTDKLKRYRSKEYALTKSHFDELFPLLKLPFYLLMVIIRSKLNVLEKVCALVALSASFPLRYFAGKMQ